MSILSIGEVARQAGVPPSTLRYYEQVGLIDPPQRVNGRRRYNIDVLQRLQIIRTAQRLGFTIGEIHRLLHGFARDVPPAARWAILSRHKLAEVTLLLRHVEQMHQALTATLHCDCATLEACATGATDD